MPPGPIPKRTAERRRRNKPETPIKKLAHSKNAGPPPPQKHWNAQARAIHKAITQSPQTELYDYSDWEIAKQFCEQWHRYYEKPDDQPINAQLLNSLLRMSSQLMLTEADRRRAGVEIDPAPRDHQGTPEGVTAIDEYRKQLAS